MTVETLNPAHESVRSGTSEVFPAPYDGDRLDEQSLLGQESSDQGWPAVDGVSPDSQPEVPGITDMLRSLSAANIKRELSDFTDRAVNKGMYSDAEEAQASIVQEAAEYKARHALTINMTADSVVRLARAGKMETFWNHLQETGSLQDISGSPTSNYKAIHSDYATYRRSVEDGLRVFVQPENRDKNPIYAALATEGDDMREGVAPSYGNWNVIIESSRAEASSVFSFSDSFTGIGGPDVEFKDKYILDADGAFIAKAIHMHESNLLDPSVALLPSKALRNKNIANYVEAAIFDDVEVDDVAAVVCNLHDIGETRSAAQALQQLGRLKDKVRFAIGGGIPPLVSDYLGAHYSVFENETEVQGAEDSDSHWQELGVTAMFTPEEINAAIDTRIAELWDSISRKFQYKGLGYGREYFKNITFKDDDQWHNTRASALRAQRDSRPYYGDADNVVKMQDWKLYGQILDLREAQAFFAAA